MSKELAKEYAQIKLEIARLEEKMKAMQPEVLAYIQAAVDAKVPAKIDELGNFSWYIKKNYTFSAEYDALIEAAEARKADELARGTYKEVVEVPILKFSPTKPV